MSGKPVPACDVVDGCPNPSIDVVGGEVWYCAEHEEGAYEAYIAWRNSPQRAARVAAGESAHRVAQAILDDFDAGCRGEGDHDMRGLLWEVIEDIRLAYRVAMIDALDTAPADQIIATVESTVNDYVVNNYGDD